MLNQTEFRGKYNSFIVLYQKNPAQIYIYIINEKVDREKAKISFIHSSAIQNIWILVSLLFFTVIVIIIQSLYGNDAFPLTSFIFFNGILLQDGGKKRLRLKGRV